MVQRQVNIQREVQSLKTTQTVSQQRLLLAQLIELPVNQLLDRINTEMNDNPALESGSDYDEGDMMDVSSDPYDDAGNDISNDAGGDIGNDIGNDGSNADDALSTEYHDEKEERRMALDDALNNLGRDDEDLPVYHGGINQDEDRDEIVAANTTSFYDLLNEQMGEAMLTDHQHYIMEYIIGSLDDDGLLRKDSDIIVDELAVYNNFYTDKQEVDATISILQTFDPPGIGARDLKECLLLQISRRPASELKDMMQKVINKMFDDFTKKNWQKIVNSLKLDEEQAERLFGELRRLNPKPGAAIGEVIGRSMQQITPDFIIDTQDDGTVTFSLNNGEIPELHVSQSFAELIGEYRNNPNNMSRQVKEALLYTRKKIAAAQSFIDAVKSRKRTLSITMAAIIKHQHKFFEEGDESAIRPMILKDIAEATGLDISTVSRVTDSKYALTRWGTFPLRFFFSDGYVTQSGEQLSTRQIKVALKDVVDNEDKGNPLSDDLIKEELAKRGFPIARRTVTKYREQLGIPVAKLRR